MHPSTESTRHAITFVACVRLRPSSPWHIREVKRCGLLLPATALGSTAWPHRYLSIGRRVRCKAQSARLVHCFHVFTRLAWRTGHNGRSSFTLRGGPTLPPACCRITGACCRITERRRAAEKTRRTRRRVRCAAELAPNSDVDAGGHRREGVCHYGYGFV